MLHRLVDAVLSRSAVSAHRGKFTRFGLNDGTVVDCSHAERAEMGAHRSIAESLRRIRAGGYGSTLPGPSLQPRHWCV